MPKVTRQGDLCTGHASFPPRASVQGSPDVTANGLPIHRMTDAWDIHTSSDGPPHPSALGEGSGSVTINGLAAGRVGDAIICGSKVATGSPDISIGD